MCYFVNMYTPNEHVLTETLCACPLGKFRCNDGETCYPASEICDGDKDCEAGEDEIGCSKSCFMLTNCV